MANAQSGWMQYQQIVAKAWGNEMFRNKLLRDPAATLAQEGVAVPAGVQVKVVQDSDSVMHLVLPVKPAGADKPEDFALC